MAINSISLNKVAANVTSPVVSSTDTETKSIQNQITNKQQSLKRLTSDTEMSAEEKAKEQQEIRKQIAELNRKLRMLQMEKEEEAKEAKKEQEQKNVSDENEAKEVSKEKSDKSISDENIKEQQKKTNIPPQNIQKMLEADNLLQKERIQQNVYQEKELAKDMLETEIKSDEFYGNDTTVKKQELSDLMKKELVDIKINEPHEKQEAQSIFNENKSMKIIIREDSI